MSMRSLRCSADSSLSADSTMLRGGGRVEGSEEPPARRSNEEPSPSSDNKAEAIAAAESVASCCGVLAVDDAVPAGDCVSFSPPVPPACAAAAAPRARVAAFHLRGSMVRPPALSRWMAMARMLRLLVRSTCESNDASALRKALWD